MKRLITADSTPRQRFIWRCPTCDKGGWSTTQHGALRQLHTHWRSCPDPRRPGPEKR